MNPTRPHLVPIRIYFSVFAALMLFIYLTVQIAFFDLGGLFRLGILLTLTMTDYATRVWRTFG